MNRKNVRTELEKVQKNPYAIRNIKNPSPEIILYVIDTKGLEAFTSFTKPMLENYDIDEDWQVVAVSKRPRDITFLKDPSERVQVAACARDFRALEGLASACLAAKLAAVRMLSISDDYVEITSRAIDVLMSGEFSEELQSSIINSTELMLNGKALKLLKRTKRFFKKFDPRGQIVIRNRYYDIFDNYADNVL